MRGATSPLPQYIYRAGCLVKHSGIFTSIFSLHKARALNVKVITKCRDLHENVSFSGNCLVHYVSIIPFAFTAVGAILYQMQQFLTGHSTHNDVITFYFLSSQNPKHIRLSRVISTLNKQISLDKISHYFQC
jgi:hypothetical protein